MRFIVPALVFAATLALLRPPGAEWPEAVAHMRAKKRHGTLRSAVLQVHNRWEQRRWQGVGDLLLERAAIRQHNWEDAAGKSLWAADLGVVAFGCTHKACYVGVLGGWRRWAAEYDRYALLAVHGAACLLSQTDTGQFHATFSPRWSRPLTIPLSLFATGHLMELMWLSSVLLGLAGELQRLVGRANFVVLYLGGGLSASLLGLLWRHSTTGAGGVLACVAFHVLERPHVRHSIFGLEMGGNVALAVQLGLTCYPSLAGGRAGRPLLVLAMGALPAAVGAALWWSRLLRPGA